MGGGEEKTKIQDSKRDILNRHKRKDRRRNGRPYMGLKGRRE